MFGYFSEDAAELFGTYFYIDATGKEVEVTQVFNVKANGDAEYHWSDRKCVGEVKELVRYGREPIRFDRNGIPRLGKKAAK